MIIGWSGMMQHIAVPAKDLVASQEVSIEQVVTVCPVAAAHQSGLIGICSKPGPTHVVLCDLQLLVCCLHDVLHS